VEFPPPLWTEWDDVDGFAEALSIHIKRHGDSVRHLFYAIAKIDRLPISGRLCAGPAASWFRARSSLEVLARIERLISEEDIARVWTAACDDMYPRPAAETVRSFLMLRIGLHTGLRQKNLRELLVCPPGRTPTSERNLEDMKCGEMRWSEREQGWEVLVPSIAFKNATSSFFGQKPFRLVLPDMGRLYEMIDAYVDRHRGRLLGQAADPGTFFVKTVKQTSTVATYDQTTFYEAWRLVIRRYGIFNPWTGRGAVKGLLPHGPHNVRDVLATHILKKTGSYEQASYAIQDTPDMVAQHYGRFLPQDKAAIAAKVLNRVWDES
jgi:hypothetical protein